MSKTRIKQISFLLALIMLFGAMSIMITAQPDDTLYSANWANGSVWLYPSVNGMATITHTSQFPSKLIVTKASDGWYYITNTDWLAEFDDRRYVPEHYLTNISPLQNTATAQIGAFTVSVDGAIPSDAKLMMSLVDEEAYDPELENMITVNMGELLGAYDIKIMQNETEWQPAMGELVTVVMNAAAWGCFTGDQVYIIHIHKNADGSKEFQQIGPLDVKKGQVSFETDKFSDYYVFASGNAYDTRLSDGEEGVFYVEPGTKLEFTVGSGWRNGDATLTKTSAASNTDDYFTMEGNAVAIRADAPVGAQIAYTATYEYNGWLGGSGSYTATIRIEVSSRYDVVNNYVQNSAIMIAILNQANLDGKFPSEPTNTSGTYYHITDTDGNGTYEGATSGNFHAEANNYLNASVIASSPVFQYDPAGSQIAGLVDPTGVLTKEAFIVNGQQTIDWDQIAEIIANYNNGSNRIAVKYHQEATDANGNQTTSVKTVYLSPNENYTVQYYKGIGQDLDGQHVYWKEFQLIPYVIKHMTDNVWHVDVAVVRGDSYVLGYNLNLGDTTTNQTVTLPDAQIVVENPDDDNDEIKVTVGAAPSRTNLNVTNADGVTGTLTFRGWYTAPTCPNTDLLIQPNAEITITNSTTLYAIWEISAELQQEQNNLAIHNRVVLASGSPFGSALPMAGQSNFVDFQFVLTVPYDPDIAFEANVYVQKVDSAWEMQTVSGTLGTENYDFIIVDADTGTVTLWLAAGEAFCFFGLDVYKDAANSVVYEHDITETIINNKQRYSLQDIAGELLDTKTIRAAMSVSQATSVTFINYYFPPVAGLEIAVNGDDGEFFVFELLQNGSLYTTVVIPANVPVTITGLLAESSTTYTVQEKSTAKAWSWRWEDVEAQSGLAANAKVTFTPGVANNKWLFGNSRFSQKVN
ncbi:MAG: hypothetical protein IJC95_07350 [Clostridia bacterium]|nr:hypothetical protein [Clostridia bacterium]